MQFCGLVLMVSLNFQMLLALSGKAVGRKRNPIGLQIFTLKTVLLPTYAIVFPESELSTSLEFSWKKVLLLPSFRLQFSLL
jgi:hypothetical protein